MNIEFKNSRLQKTCNSFNRMRMEYGNATAKVLSTRLDDLAAASCLEVMNTLPGQCHSLTGNRNGQIALSLRGQNRIIFKPNHNPLPLNVGGGLDWKKVTAIKIIEINIDYH